jgi:hypothetical protein
MPFIGNKPTAVPLSGADIQDGTIQLADLSATGTKDATTFLRGDNTFASAGGVNTPMFAVTGASNAITSATYVKAQNGTELFDTDGDYDNSTNYRFTPSVAGKYYLSTRVSVDSGSNMQYMFGAIYKNGSKIAQSLKGFNNTDPISNYFSIELSMIAEANGSSDYFEAYAYMHQNGDFRSTSGENLFLGYRIIE